MIVVLGGQTPLKLAGRLPARAWCSAPQPGVHRPGRGPGALERAVRPARDPPAARRHGGHRRRGAGRRRAHRLPGARAALATCSAGGPWRSSTTTTACRRPWPSWPGFGSLGTRGRAVGRAPRAHRPLPRGRHRGRRRRRPRRHRRGPHRRGHGARRGGRRALAATAPAPSRRRPRRRRPSAVIEDHTRAIADGARRRRPHQRAVRREAAARSSSSRPTPGPAARSRSWPRPPACRWPRWRPGSWSAPRWPSCAPRGCSADPAPRRPRGREGGGAAVQPLPRRRHAARPRDALDRRGHGHRPPRSGWRSPRARSRPATGCPTRGTVFLSLADRDKAGGLLAARRFVELGFEHRRHARAPPPYLRGARRPGGGRGGQAGGEARDRAPTPSSSSPAGKVDLVVNTPRGRGPRADGATSARPAVRTAFPASRPWPPRSPPAEAMAARPRRRSGASGPRRQYHRRQPEPTRSPLVTGPAHACDRRGRPRHAGRARSRSPTR